MTDPTLAASARQRSGFLFSIGAYILWGLLPGFFLLLVPAGPFEIVAFRILFALVFCVLIITATRRWPLIVGIVRQPRLLLLMGLAGALIFVNWQVFVLAALSGRVTESALGYFINPVFTVILGVTFLRERLRVTQWVAVGISVVAVVVLAIESGSFPWTALALAISFGFYGLVKNRVGSRVDAVTGLTIETAWLVPVAATVLVVVGTTSGLTFGHGVVHTLLLVSSGIATAVPLLLFAAGARRLPLVYMGLIQYLNPVLQFIAGVFVLHETMTPGRWFGFALVWLALVVLSIDLVRRARASRRVASDLG